MSRYPITLTPHSSLFIGGYAQAGGQSDGDTAADHAGVLIPGSAVKGALREAAVRLVCGAGRGDAFLRTLFGDEGVEGVIRVGPLRPELGEEGSSESRDPSLPEPSLRMHVSLERQRRQAAPQRLFQNRVTAAGWGLRFRGALDTVSPLADEELAFLRTAAAITDQLGGGRGRGLGMVTLEIGESLPDPGEGSPAALPEGSALVLVLEAAEPLQLAGIKDKTNYIACKEHLDGSMARGAVAVRLDPAALDEVMGGTAPACFGDGRPGSPSSIPAPLTLNQPKGGGSFYDEAALLCAEARTGQLLDRPQDLRRVVGTIHENAEDWTQVKLKRRTITRTARDHASGRGADGQLYSLEVIDPVLGSEMGEPQQPLRFYVPVRGDKSQLQAILHAAGRDLFVGGDRSRGLGRLRLVGMEDRSHLPAIEERHRRWAGALTRLGISAPENTGVLLAVGPLALDVERLKRSLAARKLELIAGVTRRQVHGGWNQRVSLPRNLTSQFVPGSTFIVAHLDGGSALPALEALEEEGLGPGRPDGWGWLVACHPVHVDCAKEESVCRR